MKNKIRKIGLTSVLLTTTVLSISALAIWAFWWEPNSLVTHNYAIELEDWPPACDGLKIAVLADLHVGSPYNDITKLKYIVDTTNQQQPDLILLAGDYVIQGVVGGSFVAPELAAQELANLSAKLGVHAVLGNHDWWLDSQRVAAALTLVGINVLEDQNTSIAYANCRFTLAGISDYWEGAHDIDSALAGHNPAHPLLAFTHNPDIIPDLPATVDLLIAGHTHGGQVNLPFLGRLVVPSAYGKRFAIGKIETNTTYAFVSPGTGTSILPVRFRVPPEISILKLSSRQNTPAQGE